MSAGYTPGARRLGVPALLMSDASLGVINPGYRPGDTATALSAGIAMGAGFNPELARRLRYLTRAAGGERMRLRGFERVELQLGRSQRVTVTADPRLLARFDGQAGQWRITKGAHQIAPGKAADKPRPDGRGSPDQTAIRPMTVAAASLNWLAFRRVGARPVGKEDDMATADRTGPRETR